MKNLQELMTWLEAERVNASGYSEIKTRGEGYQAYWGGKANAFTQVINKLDLLLAQQPNNEIAPPLQQAAVSGRSEQLPPSPYQWLKAKFQIPEGSSYVQPKDITMTQAAGWISEYVQLFGGNCH